MDNNLLSLKWHNHSTTFLKSLEVLHQQKEYTDVTLACDGSLFPAHRLVLSTCSDYIASMLQNIQCKCPVIVLKDIKKHQLTALLRYMYLGEVDVKQNDLAGLIKAAECLEIKGLAVPDQPPQEKKSDNNDTSHKRSKSPNMQSRSNKRTCVSPDSDLRETNKKHCKETNNCKNNEKNEQSVNQINSESIVKQESNKDVLNDLYDVDIKEEKKDTDDTDIIWDQPLDERESMNHSFITDIDHFNTDSIKTLPGPSHEQESREEWANSGGEDFNQILYNNGDQMDQSMMHEDNHHLGVTRLNANSTDFNQIISTSVQLKDGSFVKMFACQYCSYMTKHKHNLIHHVRIHSGEKPFKCNICDYETSFPSSLKRHMSVHTKDKKYQCSSCSYTCSQRSQFMLHCTNNH